MGPYVLLHTQHSLENECAPSAHAHRGTSGASTATCRCTPRGTGACTPAAAAPSRRPPGAPAEHLSQRIPDSIEVSTAISPSPRSPPLIVYANVAAAHGSR